jgi:hypothetical protein
VFFDELVREPVAAMRALSSFLGISFMAVTADPYQHDPRSIMTDPVHPIARMLGDVKFRQHGRVRGAGSHAAHELAEQSGGQLTGPGPADRFRLGCGGHGRLRNVAPLGH